MEQLKEQQTKTLEAESDCTTYSARILNLEAEVKRLSSQVDKSHDATDEVN